MNADARKVLGKARRAIRAAEMLLQHDDVDFAAGRAYYAMFYIAEALLSEKGFRSRKHGGVHALFGEHFAKTGLMDAKFHRFLLDAFDRRLQADYGFDAVIGQAEVTRMIEQAREFLAEAEKFLK
ncbi:MAG: HEPN domain-containing protein [Terriglobia bacterium]